MKRFILPWLMGIVQLAAVSRAGAQEALCMNEMQVCNLDQYVDPSWNYGAWVEIYNDGDQEVQLRGCWLSDDPEQPRKVRITQSTIVPAHGFKNLWFGHHDKYCLSQIDMKLNPEGGVLCLTTSAGAELARVDYPAIAPRSSYARMTDGGEEWVLSNTPTPEQTNQGMKACTERLEAPVVTHQSGMFDGSLTFSVGIPRGCTLRYTTDGSTPTLTNGATSTNGLFTIRQTAVYRFALFEESHLSSPVVTRSFILRDKTFTLPVMSVVTAPDNLYSDAIGIFVQGVNGRPGRGQSSKCNWNMDWDRPCNFELIDADGRSLVNQEADMSRCGAWSRAHTPYSFKIHATKYYEGRNTLDYPFFAAKPYLKHKMLQIRNGGNDRTARVTDAFLQQAVLTSGLDVDCLEYLPVAHYINGVYKGVINMREPSNKQFVYANYGLDDDEIDLFEMDADTGYVQKCGTKNAWRQLYTYSRLASSPTYYGRICDMLDVDEFCNYMAVEFYLCNWDWPNNNLKGFKPNYEGGRFRFILYDIDGSFSDMNAFTTFESKKTYTFNTLFGQPVTNYTKEIELVTIFRNLLNNSTFRKRFIDTFCLVAGSVFEPERCRELMTRLAERVYDMQILPDNGYGRNSSPWGTTNSIINALASRQPTMIAQLKNYLPMRLSDVVGQSIQLESNIGEARLQVNDMVVPTGRFSGTLFPPVTLKASAPQGYRFLGWYDASADESKLKQTLFEQGSPWTYSDQGALENSDWTATDFAETEWKQGQAPLGYGNNGTFGTTISYGSNANQKHPVYYFRRTFHLAEPVSNDTKFFFSYYLDDGMVLYVNGAEALRVNMPSGTISGTTFSSSYAENNMLTGTVALDPKLFRQGENVVAVSVHNNSYTSTDIYWDASLVMQQSPRYDETTDFVSTEPEMEMPSTDKALHLRACFAREDRQSGGEAPQKTVVINELSAGNSIYVNEYFKKNDWVELYNMTDEDIDLEGYYLSDNAKQPLKCLIEGGETASTILPAHGYKVIWCDQLPTSSQLHVGFKLGNEDGEMVILTSPDLAWADTLVYSQHDGMQTVGRFPDGGSDIYLMTKPTIGNPNAMNSYTKLCTPETEDPNPDAIRQAHSSGLSIAFAEDELRIKNENSNLVTYNVYTISGQLVAKGELQMKNAHGSITLSPLTGGVYVVRVSDADGNSCSTKFQK